MIATVNAESKDLLLNLEFNEFELELKKYAKEFNVPIIQDAGLALLEEVIALLKPKNILEIGTAIGYSALRMNKVCNSNVYTIERNQDMYNKAIENITKASKNDSIHIIFKDALEAYSEVSNVKFDLIFIDAAKAQYKKFFDIYSPLLNEGGAIVCDNMLFHGLVESDDYMNQSRSVRGLIRKLKAFHEDLLNNKDYKTSLFDIGDGISISVKK